MAERLTARPGEAPAPGTALMVVLLLTMGVGPLLNYGLSSTSALLIDDLRITPSSFGLLITVLFLSAAAASMVLGRLADVLSIRAQLVFNFGGTALALLVSAIGPQYWILMVAMVLVGPAQVIANPTTNRVIYQAVPAAKRPGWIGIKQSGVQVSQLAAGVLFPPAVLLVGWSGAAVGAAVAVLLLLWWSLGHVPPEPPTDWGRLRTAARSALRRRRPAASVPLPLTVWLFTAVAFVSGAGTQATNVYLPLFAVREMQYSLVVGGFAAGLSGVIGVASRVGWGRLLGRGRAPGAILVLIASGALLGMASMVGAALTGWVPLFWAGVALHGITVLGTNVVVNAGTMQAVGRGQIGAASGATTMGMYAGFAVGPFGMGLVVEFSGGFALGWILVGVAYLLLLVLALLTLRAGRRA
ncbi:MFS transporter [Citricoccus sp. SGAir0253]|uniref:MFS transporter n=1 Tax=Citricoccus sp. SGAir0253 TaxID=2567881 RepID=UPI0010CD461C|nr:MFS transporter [Citricoccus sp. SGAir0253]QCU77215.1 MFS transporter [Citricoccus sp. SGAir0253]